MKSSVDAKAFADALKKAGGILKKFAIPSLEEIHVDFSGGICTVTATDLNMWIVADIPADGDDFSFSFKNTNKVMKACQYYAGTLNISLSGDEDEPVLTMSCGGKTAEFMVMKGEMFPELPELQATHHYWTNSASLLERVNLIKYASVKSEQKPVFEGVRFQDCRLWCVDGYRIALNEDSNLYVREPFIVPVSALKQLKIFEKADVELAVGKRYVCISGKTISLYSRLLEPSDDMQLEGVIPVQYRERYQIKRKQYMDALNYLGANLHKGSKPYISFRSGSLILLTPSAQYSAEMDTDCVCEIDYSFDLRYMKDALGQFPGEDFVAFQAAGELSPVVLTDGKGNTAMVLTVRIKKDARSSAA